MILILMIFGGSYGRSLRDRGQARNLLHHVEVLALAEDAVVPVQVAAWNFSNEELRAVRIRPAVRHGQAAGLIERQVGADLVLEL